MWCRKNSWYSRLRPKCCCRTTLENLRIIVTCQMGKNQFPTWSPILMPNAKINLSWAVSDYQGIRDGPLVVWFSIRALNKFRCAMYQQQGFGMKWPSSSPGLYRCFAIYNHQTCGNRLTKQTCRKSQGNSITVQYLGNCFTFSTKQ